MPLSIRSWECSFGPACCFALWMTGFPLCSSACFCFLFCFLYFAIKFHLHWRSVMGSEKGVKFAAMGRRKVILMVEGRVREAGGGTCKLLNGESKARDGDLSCLLCPLVCYVGWLPLSGGGSVTEHGDLSIILTSLIPQRELAMTTNLYTCCLFLIFSLHVSCRTLSTHLFVFQNFSLLKLKSHLYNLLSTLWSWYLKCVIVYQHSLQVYIVSYCLRIGLCQI